jgi:phosphate/sulfate permease
MKPMAIVAGVVAGLVGALVWAAIAYYAHIQLGILAWAIGGLVGVAVAVGSKGETNSVSGGVAAIIALGAILGGKYFTAMAFASDYAPKLTMTTTDESAQETFAFRLAKEAESAGRKLTWPQGKDAESAEGLNDYPKDIVKQAQEKWAAMPAAEQASFKADQDRDARVLMSTVKSAMTMTAFKSSFTVFSIIFCVLALITAFKVGGGIAGGD